MYPQPSSTSPVKMKCSHNSSDLKLTRGTCGCVSTARIARAEGRAERRTAISDLLASACVLRVLEPST